MKTEEQILLNYMYAEGYTDEDMHNPNALKVVRSSLGFQMILMKHQFKNLAKVIGDAFKEVGKQLAEALRPAVAWMQEVYEEQEQMDKRKQSFKPFIPKHRSRFSHQVIDRKPRHINKKIIR